MTDKTNNLITAILLLIFGVGGVLVSLVHAIPTYGVIGVAPLLISIGALVIGLDKDTK